MHSLNEIWDHLFEPPVAWVIWGLGLALVVLGLLALFTTNSPSRRLRYLDTAVGVAGLFWFTASFYVVACVLGLTDPHRVDYLVLGLSLTSLLVTLAALVLALPFSRYLQYHSRYRLLDRLLGSAAARAVPAGLRRRCAEMAHQLDLAPPTLYLLEEPAPICCAVGGPRPRILLSRGLLELLGPEEREAVLAHELAHLHLTHATRQGLSALLSRSLFLDPLVSLASSAACRQREFEADALAASVTKRPVDLALALLKVTRGDSDPTAPAEATPPAAAPRQRRGRARWLYAFLPRVGPGRHPPLRERVARLLP